MIWRNKMEATSLILVEWIQFLQISAFYILAKISVVSRVSAELSIFYFNTGNLTVSYFVGQVNYVETYLSVSTNSDKYVRHFIFIHRYGLQPFMVYIASS